MEPIAGPGFDSRESRVASVAAPIASAGTVEDVWCLGDDHFAISESSLDAGRANHAGNWLADKAAEFTRSFGDIVATDTAAEPEDTLGDDEFQGCQSRLCPGLCDQAVSNIAASYGRVQEQVKNLLRHSRAVRRADGYVANHLPLLICRSVDGDPQGVEVCRIYMLARVTFSPFDATAIEFEMTGKWTAQMAVSTLTSHAGQGAMFMTLPSLVFDLAHLDLSTMMLRTARYSATSLRGITLHHDSLQGPDAVAGPVCDDDDDADPRELRSLDAKRNLFRLALRGKDKPTSHTTSSHRRLQLRQGRAKPARQAKQRVHDGSNTPSQVEPVPQLPKPEGESIPVQEDASARCDAEVEAAWHAAIDAQNPIEAASASSSRPSPSTSAKPSSSAVFKKCEPILSRTSPWRNEQGYCFIYRPDTDLAVQIGLVLTHNHQSQDSDGRRLERACVRSSAVNDVSPPTLRSDHRDEGEQAWPRCIDPL